MPTKILIILGPTATGKSALAVEIAKIITRKKWGGFNKAEIISADSRQIYKGLNIGSGKITKKEMQGIPHHLLDMANPKKRFSVAEYQKLGHEKIAEIFSRGNLPIICGGSGFYISALLGEETIPDVPPNPKLRAKLSTKNPEELMAILTNLEPKRAKTVDPHNLRRIIRVIEIAQSAKQSQTISEITCEKKIKPLFQVLKIGLNLPSNKLKYKISIRLFARIREGMIDESKQLHEKGISWKRMEELGLEYRYLAFFLQNKITEQEMISKLKTEIWRYAKRQMTWFKRDKKIKWFNPSQKTKIEKSVKKFLEG